MESKTRPGGHRRPANRSSRSRNNNRSSPKKVVHSSIRETKEAPSHDHVKSPDVIRIIPLGGVEEVGKNMSLIEYGDSIVIVDMGFQFTDEDETPGVDYIIPDTKYLEARKKKIKAIAITHGHLDHIGGIPYMIEKVGNPPIYTRRFSAAFIRKRQEEFPHLPPLTIHEVEVENRVRISDDFYMRFFRVTHTVPDSMGVIFETPYGNVVFTGDLKVDHDDQVPLAHEQESFGKLSAENNLMLLSDSTNADNPGWSFSEHFVQDSLKKVIDEAPGRLIIGTFASLLERVMFIIEYAEKLGKKVVIDGRSMKTNVAIAKEIGYLKEHRETVIPIEDIDNYPTNKIIVIATGAQGEEFAALMRMGTGKHKKIKLTPEDTVMLSSSVIPGNERSVQWLRDNLARNGVKLIHYRIATVHAGGHAWKDELGWVYRMIKPKFFMPIHGHHYFLRVHGEIAQEAGTPKENIIVPDNGTIVEIYDKGTKIRRLKDLASTGDVMVDALGTGDVKDVVIRDRQQLSQEGIFVIFAMVDMKTGKVVKSPDILSRGFIYLKESQELLREARHIIRRTIEESTANMNPLNFDYIKNNLREKIGRFLLQKTGKRPIVLPAIAEV